MRLYTFNNMYLSSLQNGLQTAHAVHEMFIRYPDRMSGAGVYLWDWAENHKTMILLNGGYAATIQELADFFDTTDNPYPFAPFYEEEASLNGALTTVGIILPEKIYSIAAAIRSDCEWIRDQIWDNGELVVRPENTFGIDTTKNITLSYTKLEARLIDRLNGFTQMAS